LKKSSALRAIPGIVTGHSDNVTSDSGNTPEIGHDQSESAVTLHRNRRSRSNGMGGHDGPEYARPARLTAGHPKKARITRLAAPASPTSERRRADPRGLAQGRLAPVGLAAHLSFRFPDLTLRAEISSWFWMQ
jgi:hypothetical protein